MKARPPSSRPGPRGAALNASSRASPRLPQLILDLLLSIDAFLPSPEQLYPARLEESTRARAPGALPPASLFPKHHLPFEKFSCAPTRLVGAGLRADRPGSGRPSFVTRACPIQPWQDASSRPAGACSSLDELLSSQLQLLVCSSARICAFSASALTSDAWRE